MRKWFLFLSTLCLGSSTTIYSQNNISYKFDRITPADFNIQSPAVDSNAGAVIIADAGSTYFVGNERGWLNSVYKKKIRIKVMNKSALDVANVRIELYEKEGDAENIEGITATTYNLDNGVVAATKLDKTNIFTEKYDRNHTEVKFALPSVIAGSIIEYSYTIKSNFLFNIPSWEFQNINYPTLWSEYNVSIPGLLTYMSLRQGFHRFEVDKTEEGRENYAVTLKHGSGYSQTEERLNVSSAVVKHKWVMKNVPPIPHEDFISTPKNFIDKIEFQLHQTYNGERVQDVYTTWDKIVDELLKRQDFGAPVYDNNPHIQALVKNIIKSNDAASQQAKDIYYYVQKNFICNDDHQKYLKKDLDDVLKKKVGNVGEINLLLTTLLQQIDVAAYPVILSTKDFGRSFQKYPKIDQYNYVICKLNINDSVFYLDATEPMLAFGKLPLKCYNGFAKIISKDSAAVILDASAIKETKRTLVIINADDKNEVQGFVTKDYPYYESLRLRSDIAKNSLEQFKKKVSENISSENITISNVEVDSFSNFESPVTVKYDLDFKEFNNSDLIYFYPMLDEAIKKNPFASQERIYPVEMTSARDETFTLNMEVPKGYIVDEIPKSLKMALPNNDGYFEFLVLVNNGFIQMRSRLQLNKAYFDSEAYESLRNLFASIVKKHSEPIVFKKNQ
jgi:hypothetical protein